MKLFFNGIIPCILVAFLLIGCSKSAKRDDEFSIEGSVRGMAGKTLHLEKITGAIAEPIADVMIDEKGGFSVHAKGELNTIFQLRADDGGRIMLFPEFSALKVEADGEEMEAFQVTGSEKTQRLRNFNLEQYRLYLDYVASESRLDALDREKDTIVWHELEAVTDKALMSYRSFMRTYCDTVSLPILRAFSALSLTANGNYHYLNKLVGRLRREIPNSSYVAEIEASLNKEADGKIGEVAANITGPDLAGKSFDFQSLRGKSVLLYFWASYCEFSRIENLELAKMADFFAANNVAVVFFSIDDHANDWQEYLKTAGLEYGIHLRGLTGSRSMEIGQFRVKSIPANYLIDSNGVIRDLDIRAAELISDLPSLVGSMQKMPAGGQ